MNREKVVFVKCELLRGSIPTECLFRLHTDAGIFHGIAFIKYCYTEKREPVKPEMLSTTPIEGYVVGIEIEEIGRKPRVELPNGKLYEINEELILPVEEDSSVSLQS